MRTITGMTFVPVQLHDIYTHTQRKREKGREIFEESKKYTNKTNQEMSVRYATATENNDLHSHTPKPFLSN